MTVDEILLPEYTREELEQHRQEILERVRQLRLIDDDFMNVCFDGFIEGTELVLSIILGKSDIHVKSVKTQQKMTNLVGRDIWLDIAASDDSGQEYNIEIQRSDKGADRRRARYHSSILDANLLKPAQDFSKLPETYVIFITEHDVLGESFPIYCIERKIEGINKPFNDGEHIVYVNGSDKNAATALGRLMHDFYCANPDDMYYKILADKTRYFKEDEKGEETMCQIIEEYANKRGEQIEERVTERERVQTALGLIKSGKLTLEEIALYSRLALDRVRELAAAQ